MSISTMRAGIAEALSQVDGVKGNAYRPAAPKAGDAWPLLGSVDRADGFAFTYNWRVMVALPGDERAASAWIDQHIEAVIDALEPLAYVDGFAPVVLDTNGSAAAFGLQINMRSE